MVKDEYYPHKPVVDNALSLLYYFREPPKKSRKKLLKAFEGFVRNFGEIDENYQHCAFNLFEIFEEESGEQER